MRITGETDEQRWQAALEAKGAEWVKAKLRERPGRPDDVLLDIVFEGRQPTRIFCQNWCVQQDNHLFRLTPTGIAMWAAVIVMVAFIVRGYIAWEGPPDPSQIAAAPGDVMPAPVSNTDIDTLMEDRTVPVDSSSTTQSTPSAAATDLCGYTSYDTHRCGSSQP